VADAGGGQRKARLLQILAFHGLERIERDEAGAGDIIAFTGIEGLKISDTICDPETPEALPALVVDEPTISMTFQVNDSPFGGREGKYVTSRNLKERLERELHAQRRAAGRADRRSDKFKVSGRGELHLGDLDRDHAPRGLRARHLPPGGDPPKEVDGEVCEPWETLTIDVEEPHQGAVMEKLGERRGAQGHGARRQGPGAPRLPDPEPRADRLPLRLPDAHVGDRG
jgi:GTP-binding protein